MENFVNAQQKSWAARNLNNSVQLEWERGVWPIGSSEWQQMLGTNSPIKYFCDINLINRWSYFLRVNPFWQIPRNQYESSILGFLFFRNKPTNQINKDWTRKSWFVRIWDSWIWIFKDFVLCYSTKDLWGCVGFIKTGWIFENLPDLCLTIRIEPYEVWICFCDPQIECLKFRIHDPWNNTNPRVHDSLIGFPQPYKNLPVMQILMLILPFLDD